MMVRILYPVPTDNWETFRPFVERFVRTYRQFKPWTPHVVVAVTFGCYPDKELFELFEELPTIWLRYNGAGMDIGAAQFAAKRAYPDEFQINFTSRAYFHRAGWLEMMLEGYEPETCPTLCGMSASREGGKLHVCTRGYGLTCGDFCRYPTEIVSRDQGVYFECGDGSLTDWARQNGLFRSVITFRGAWPIDLDAFTDPDGFRQGDQSSMLAWDKHTDAYANADAAEKARLQALMLGKELPAPASPV